MLQQQHYQGCGYQQRNTHAHIPCQRTEMKPGYPCRALLGTRSLTCGHRCSSRSMLQHVVVAGSMFVLKDACLLCCPASTAALPRPCHCQECRSSHRVKACCFTAVLMLSCKHSRSITVLPLPKRIAFNSEPRPAALLLLHTCCPASITAVKRGVPRPPTTH
jgi:hypothetical protein